ncbi:hypothetical protein BC629DRAFT_1598041 [Irpex lacteus]|nr:hypothetical protein BC629DRAFT_1598041 [Irpex lacteus]
MEHVGDSIGTVWEWLEGYESSKPAEEAGMINDTKYDLEILASADALQADDRLLGTTIKSALEQSDANWVQLLEFTLQVIGNRIPVVDSETNLEHILSAYRSLSPSICEVVYTNAEDIHQLSNVIHNIVDYNSSNFESLKAIEILKLSLLSVRVMYGKIHDNRDSRPRWSSVQAAQWKRTFIWLARRLYYFWPFSNLSPNELAALQQLARSGWREIPDLTEDSSQQALPLPDLFYYMLWRTAGEDLSQIPSQHPQLLRIAHMSSDEQFEIRNKGLAMARAYRRNPGNLYPPGTEDNDGEALGGVQTSAPLQVFQDFIPIDSGIDADELGVFGGLQLELPVDTSNASPSESRAPSEAGLRATRAAEQQSRTNSGPAGSIQPGQTQSPIHETSQDSEHTGSIQSETVDGQDDPKELQPEGTPMELPEEVEDLAGIAAHQASAESGTTSSIADWLTAPASLPTGACDETIPAETRDGLEVTADNVQAYSILDHAASSLCDNAAGEDDLQRMDNIAAAAGSSHTVQESSVESSAERALTGEEVVTSSLDNKQATEAEARDVEQRV